MRALLGALKQPAEKSGVPQLNSPAVDRERRRREFLAAARRLQDGDIWKEKVKAQLNIETLEESSTQMWTNKAVKENFQRWLEAPGSSAPFDFQKIFKTLGYSMDLTQRNLAPAVPFILILRIIAEAKNMDQVKRATRWFLKVGEEGFRFKQTNQFVEFMRRAMNLRRGVGASWDGWGVWRASEDHTLVAQGSKLRLEQGRESSSIWQSQERPRTRPAASGQEQPL